jgi:hypothetical protein
VNSNSNSELDPLAPHEPEESENSELPTLGARVLVLKEHLKIYALPIAGVSFAAGVACIGLSLPGYFNDRIRYCDGRTNPCTWVTVPSWYELPQEAKLKKRLKGRGLARTLFSLAGALAAFPVSFIALKVALENQRQIDEKLHWDEELEEARSLILTDEAKQKIALAATLRIKDFRQQLYEGYAEMYLEDHPELLERLTRSEMKEIEEIPDSPEQQTENPALLSANTPEQQSPSSQKSSPQSSIPSAPDGNSNGVDNTGDNRVENGSGEGQIIQVADKWAEYRHIGESIIKSMVVSDKSVLLASGTGTGKTTTEEYYLRQFLARNPTAEVYALLNKNDSLYGVRNDRSLVFDPEWLDALPVGKDKASERRAIIEQALAPLYTVYRIFLNRKKLPKEERKRLKETKPIRLVLGDWYGTYQELQARLFPHELQSVLSKPRQVITIGRDLGVGFYIDTQSDKLDAVGIAGDASIRQSLDIYSQGFIYYEDGEEKGELQTIRLVFDNNKICSTQDREEISKVYYLLANAIKNGEINTPIVFTSVGSKPRIGIVPSLADLTTSSQVNWEDIIQDLNRRYLQSEFMLGELPKDESESKVEQVNEGKSQGVTSEQLIKYGDYLVGKLNGKDWVLVSKLGGVAWKTRDWGENVLNLVIQDLVKRELVEVDTKDGIKRIRITG